MQTWLESIAKVPYDNTGGSLHRIDTLGHDPVLGFIFGVIEIMTKGVPNNGGFEAVHNPFKAILIQFLHLVSDVATTRGLPVPFAPVLRQLKVGTFRVGNAQMDLSQMMGWMYHHGYDLRHFITMGITPATIEIILRAYLMIRHYVEKGETTITLTNNPKYRSMLLSAHSVAAAANLGKLAIYQWNPLAINYAEWLALIRYLLPSVKYWLFDRHRLKMEYLENVTDKEWNELMLSSYELLIKTNFNNLETAKIGTACRSVNYKNGGIK